jgi:prephenate dehydratase
VENEQPWCWSGHSASPGPLRRFAYLFYIDFIGTLADPHCQNALRHLQVCFRLLA